MEEYRNYMYFVEVPDTGIEGCYFEPEYFDEAAEAIKFAMELVDDDPETRVIVARVGFDDFDELGNPEVQSQEEEIIWDSFEDDYEEDAEEEAEEANEVDYEEAERDARVKFDQGDWDETKPSQAYLEGEGCENCEEGCKGEGCEKKLEECGPVEEACEEKLEECGDAKVEEACEEKLEECGELNELFGFGKNKKDNDDDDNDKSKNKARRVSIEIYDEHGSVVATFTTEEYPGKLIAEDQLKKKIKDGWNGVLRQYRQSDRKYDWHYSRKSEPADERDTKFADISDIIYESLNKADAAKLDTFDGKRPERLDVNSPKTELNEDGEEFLDYYLDIPDGDEEEAALKVLEADVDPFDVKEWPKPTEEE